MNNNLSSEDLIELGKMLIAVANDKPIEYRVNGSGDPWQDYDYSNGFDLEYEIHCFRQGKRFRLKDMKEVECQKKIQENRRLKQLLLMGVPIQYHQFHNWHSVKDIEHFIELEKEVYTDFRIPPTFNKSLVFYSYKKKELHLDPKQGDTFVGTGEKYVDWAKANLKWQISEKSDKTYYIQPFDGTSAESWADCEDHLLQLTWQGEHTAKL